MKDRFSWIAWAALVALALPACGDDDGPGPAPADTGMPDGGAPADLGPPDEDTGTGDDAGSPDAGMPPSCEGLDPSVAPEPRGDQVAVFDAARGRLVVWGGDRGVPVMCFPSPDYVDELWLYDAACAAWSRVDAAGGPGARARASAVLDPSRDRMLVFGGRRPLGGGRYELFGDLWALDLETLSWSEVPVAGDAPEGRANATLVLDAARDRLVLFGGNLSGDGASFRPMNDTWAFDLASGGWQQIASGGTAPDRRLFHAAAVTADGSRMIVVGGGDANAFTGPFLDDAWSLDLASDSWSAIAVSGERPLARISAQLVASGDGVVLIFGHDDGVLGNTNDVWRLDPAAGTWSLLAPGDELSNLDVGFCDFPPDFTTQDLDRPERRQAFGVGVDGEGGALVFGGKSDCGLVNDVWRLDLASGGWEPLRPATMGLSCQRQGRLECTSYCM